MFDHETPTVHLAAAPQKLSSARSIRVVAVKVLGEALTQFISQLTAMRVSDEPEVVHQARVAWRRWKSDFRLFKPTLQNVEAGIPALTPLQPLLMGLGALRDLDVALTETLPQWRSIYIDGSPKSSAALARRRRCWRQLSEDLQRSADEQRSLVRSELADPAVVATLLALTEWVDSLSKTSQSAASETVPLRRWARHRLADWHRCFKVAFKSARHSANPEQQHRARILAKRLRYGVEALGNLLPAQRRRRWRQQAVELQARLGSARDLRQAHALAVSVAAADDIQTFWLRLADESAELTADQSS